MTRTPATPFTDPAEVEARLAAAMDRAGEGATVIVDFDETLWLRNSTEEYIDALRPRWLAHLILLALDLARPWRLIAGRAGEHAYRDWLRVLVPSLLLPWSLRLWRRRAPELGRAWRNEELLRAMAASGVRRFEVATLGVDAVVAPLLAGLAPGTPLLAAGTLAAGHRIRRLGKRAWIEACHGPGRLRDAVVITDSEADADLLAAAATPLLVKWPRAEYRPAFGSSYVPFLYTQRGKRPGENYLLYGVALEDGVLLSLAYAWVMPDPLAGILALGLLHLAFWVVYELGYAENDARASRHEATPKLPPEARAYAARVRPGPAWASCALFALAGAGVLVAFNGAALRGPLAALDGVPAWAAVVAVWLAFVAASRGGYAVFNRLDTRSRGFMYLVLQGLRLLGYGLLAGTSPVGAALLLALALARWVKYLAYRDLGRHLAEDQRFLTLVAFVALLAGLAIVPGVEVFTAQALAALAWLALYARRRLVGFVADLRFHDLKGP